MLFSCDFPLLALCDAFLRPFDAFPLRELQLGAEKCEIVIDIELNWIKF